MKNVEDIYRLSPVQAGILAAGLASPAARPQVSQVCLTFDRYLSPSAFEAAWRRAIEHHPALRTAFICGELTQPLQVVRQKINLPLNRHDWRGLPADEQRERLSGYLEADAHRPFPLSKAPMMRLAHIDLAQGVSAFIWTYHHILLDTRSARLVLKDVFEFCDLLHRGTETELQPNAPYRDYIAWVARQEQAAAERHWRERLEGVAASGRAAGEIEQAPETWPYSERRVQLSAEATSGLTVLAHETNVALDTLVHGAWTLILSQQAESCDVVFGSVVSGRSPALPGIESMIGRFENLLPLSVRVDADAAALDWLKNLDARRLDLNRYDYIPLDQLQEWSGMAKGRKLFDSVVHVKEESLVASLQSTPVGEHLLAVRHLSANDQYPLWLEALVGPRLSLTVRYDARRFDDSAMTGLLERLTALLERFASAPMERLSSYGALPVRATRDAVAAETSIDVHGRAVDLEEIEAVLGQHPEISEASVAILDDPAAGKRLVAYVVPAAAHKPKTDPVQFSLFYFADDQAHSRDDKYRIYIDGAKFADRHGFKAVWTPERHFHQNGGLYPNPSVLSAALATITEQIHLRAGSVVLPLHHSLRVAEEWAVVDNLSKGRVGLSFTSGWIPNDFAFFPDRYANKRNEMFRGLQEVQTLWRGKPILNRDGAGNDFEVEIFPKPIQPELPIWLTCSGSPEMFVKAGELGANVLAALLGQSVEELAKKLALYKDSLKQHGHGPGHVTVMLHTFVGDDEQRVLEKARAPFCNYLKSHLGLIGTATKSLSIKVDRDVESNADQLVSFAFERYYRTASLIGTPEKCLQMMSRLKEIGVDEVACLIDFGISADAVLAGLHHLNSLKELCRETFGEQDCGLEPEAHGLRQFVRERLPGHMVPAAFIVLNALPLVKATPRTPRQVVL